MYSFSACTFYTMDGADITCVCETKASIFELRLLFLTICIETIVIIVIYVLMRLFCLSPFIVPTGSPPRGGDVAVYVFDVNQPSLPTPFLFCFCVYFCPYGPFNCISFHKLSRQVSAFSLYSSGLISAFLVLSTTYHFVKVSFSPDVILCGWLGLKRQLTNYLIFCFVRLLLLL